MRKEYGDHDDTGPLGDDEEFVPGDRVKLISNEKMDWGGLEGATGKISEVKPGTLGWPTVYSVKLDREWVGFEDEDTIHDLEADRLTMLGRVGSPGSGGMTDPEDEDVWYTYTTQIDSEGRERQVRVPVPKLKKSLTDAVREGLPEAVAKHGSGDQTPRRTRPGAAARKTTKTRPTRRIPSSATLTPPGPPPR